MTVTNCAFQSEAFQADAFQVCTDEPEPTPETPTPQRHMVGQLIPLRPRDAFEKQRKRENEEILIL